MSGATHVQETKTDAARSTNATQSIGGRASAGAGYSAQSAAQSPTADGGYSAQATALSPAVANEWVNMRAAGSNRAAKVCVIAKGAQVEVLETGSWMKVNYQGAEGYACQSYLDMLPAPTPEEPLVREAPLEASVPTPASEPSLLQRARAMASGAKDTLLSTADSAYSAVSDAASAVADQLTGGGDAETTTVAPSADTTVQPATVAETEKASAEEAAAVVEEPAPDTTLELSGAAWRAKATAAGWVNDTNFASLDATWGPKAEKFVTGLRGSGATVNITAGLRHPKRAMLMHYAWTVSKGQATPETANTACQAEGININWDHGDLTRSKAAAAELSAIFSLRAKPSLTSNHIRGKAIDCNITNVPAKVTVDGTEYDSGPKGTGVYDEDKVDHVGKAVGVIWYGAGDYVHWSHTGR